MEEVRGRRAVGDLHIVFGAHLQITLEPGRRMFRPLPFVTMRQQADEARHTQPFALTRRDELVEDHLRAVGEIAELRLPDGKRVRLGKWITIFAPEDGLLREFRTYDLVY